MTSVHIRAAAERAERRSRGEDPFAPIERFKPRGKPRTGVPEMVTITRTEYLLLLEAAESLKKPSRKRRRP